MSDLVSATELDELSDVDDAQPWDRRPDEPANHYAAFRVYRDLPPVQRKWAKVAEKADISERQAKLLGNKWEWRERALEWDDMLHQTEDHERIEAIRQMHAIHRVAGRTAITKAMQALQLVRPEELTPGTIARLMQLGANLERDTLLVSVEELQGFEPEDEEAEDAWERIARELDPATASTEIDER